MSSETMAYQTTTLESFMKTFWCEKCQNEYKEFDAFLNQTTESMDEHSWKICHDVLAREGDIMHVSTENTQKLDIHQICKNQSHYLGKSQELMSTDSEEGSMACKTQYSEMDDFRDDSLMDKAENPIENSLKAPESFQAEKKQFVSNIRNETFTNSAYSIIHTGERSYECEICKKRFKGISHLKQHMHTHTLEMPYECEICKKRFAKKSVLRIHFRYHTGEKPYECEICWKNYAAIGNLIRHMDYHTGERPYECEICGKNFAEIRNLRRHLYCHPR